MKKVFIEAQYRIKDRVCNWGYICIDGDSITGIFTFDYVDIQITDNSMHLSLKEYQPEKSPYYKIQEFVNATAFEGLESPCTYLLKSSNEFLSLELIRRITDPIKISDIEKTFKNFQSKKV